MPSSLLKVISDYSREKTTVKLISSAAEHSNSDEEAVSSYLKISYRVHEENKTSRFGPSVDHPKTDANTPSPDSNPGTSGPKTFSAPNQPSCYQPQGQTVNFHARRLEYVIQHHDNSLASAIVEHLRHISLRERPSHVSFCGTGPSASTICVYNNFATPPAYRSRASAKEFSCLD